MLFSVHDKFNSDIVEYRNVMRKLIKFGSTS